MHSSLFPIPSFLAQLRPWRARPSEAGRSRSQAQPLLALPLATHSEEHQQRDKLEALGQFLARQDRWDELGDMIRTLDRKRQKTPGGMAHAELLARGARLDVVRPIEQALADPGLMPQHAPRKGLPHLLAALEDELEDYGVALVVIQACIDIAWAWRGDAAVAQLPSFRKQQFCDHMQQAEILLDRFSPFEHDSPALAAARCALLPHSATANQRIAEDYQDLIELDPANPSHMRAFGNHLLPRWFGDYQMLEVEARKTALLTEDIWGSGGYAWVYLDALMLDPGAMDLLDPEFFLEGLRDILDRNPDQHLVNSLAAFCGVTCRDQKHLSRAPKALVQPLARTLEWIRDDHLRELHPLIWGQAKLGLRSGALLPSLDALGQIGLEAAQRALGQPNTATPSC